MTASEVRRGCERKEECNKERGEGVRIAGEERKAMGRERGGDGDKERIGDGSERWAWKMTWRALYIYIYVYIR